MLCARVFSSASRMTRSGMAQHVAQAEESAVVMCDEVEAVQSERIGELADAFDLGVVGGRRFGRIGAPEPWPVGGDDAVPRPAPGSGVASRMRSADSRAGAAQAHPHRVLDVHHIHFVQTSIKFAVVTRAQPRRRGRPRAYDPAVALRRAQGHVLARRVRRHLARRPGRRHGHESAEHLRGVRGQTGALPHRR